MRLDVAHILAGKYSDRKGSQHEPGTYNEPCPVRAVGCLLRQPTRISHCISKY